MKLSDIDAPLSALPGPLQADVRRQWDGLLGALGPAAEALAPTDLDAGCRVWAGSEFVARQCRQHPALLLELIDSGDLHRRYASETLAEHVQTAIDPVTDAEALGIALRHLRRREMVRIAWRDLAGQADLDETMADLSALAEGCVRGALARLHGWQQAALGTPIGAESGEAQAMVVLGMGKLGARELNFSSDIDLIFAYREAGQTAGGPRSLSNEEYFTRLGRSLIQILDANTAEGFVFRVDMRLRPFGESGALALSFAAMESYYQLHGREWERYALVKARPVAGPPADAERLLGLLQPFVYRRYLDYGTFAALREMKAMVAAEVQRKGMADNIKLGAGGIREIEFIGQAFQLIRGGREPGLRVREIQRVLRWLGEHDQLPAYVVDQLLAAYVFLRNTEHRLQEYRDQQTHALPRDDAGRLRLAFTMGYADWDAFLTALGGHRARVHSHFEQVFEAPQTAGVDASLEALWQGRLAENESLAVLQQSGFVHAETVFGRLDELRTSRRYQTLPASGRQRLDQLMPLLLAAAGGSDDADDVLPRLLTLIEAVARRSAYLALLVEHPLALSQLVRLCAASPWIADQLTRYPLLLDELLDPRTLYAPAPRAALASELRQRLAAVADDDLEQAMDALRQFKLAAVLRVAAADVMQAVPLMEVSDHLCDIAEVILAEVLALAWRDLSRCHGRPASAADDEMGFAIIAYGKLGGRELGYGSDLDMVFLHADCGHHDATQGPKVLADTVFYARLGRRIIHLLTAVTAAGQLYEVDMRLRPSGASGLLVVSLSAFAAYQRGQAWTWEHQALVRARPVSGDTTLGEGFAAVRRALLCVARDPRLLQREVREMRERMRQQLAREEGDEFDLKQGRGGIADIEFMVQFWVLRWAYAAPELTRYTDNVRLLAGLAEGGFIPAEEADSLADAYRALRAEVHRLALQERPARVSGDLFTAERETVRRLWHTYLAQPIESEE